MNATTAKNMIRRRLNERATDGWTDEEIYELINEALKMIQKKVLAIDPVAFMTIATVPTVAGSDGEFYVVPPGMWYELEVGMRTVVNGEYTTLTKGNYETIRGWSSGQTTTKYARRGNYFAIWPNPAFAIPAGLRIQYVPTLSINEAARSTALPVHAALHMAVVVWATMMAIGDTMESSSELSKELALYLEDLPMFYHAGGEAQTIQPHINRRRS